MHGLSEAAVQGGASGAIVVEGIEKIQPAVAGLPEQLLIVRDNPVPGAPEGPTVPAWDVSLNYIPIPFPKYPPAMVNIGAGERQFWRVLNASADTILDLQLQYDGVAQPLEVVALDGVPTGSQDGTSKGVIITETDILLSPAARAEFIVTGLVQRREKRDLVDAQCRYRSGRRYRSAAAAREYPDHRRRRGGNNQVGNSHGFRTAQPAALRGTGPGRTGGDPHAVFLGGAVGPQGSRQRAEFLHHRGGADSGGVQSRTIRRRS